MKCNVSIIYNIKNKKPVGTICINPLNGEVAYSTKSDELMEVLEILLDNKMFLLKTEKLKNNVFLTEQTVGLTDSYYVMALSYALPLPWWILDTFEDGGDVEDLSKLYFEKICQGSENNEEIKEKNS
jgi:hypothetical protein